MLLNKKMKGQVKEKKFQISVRVSETVHGIIGGLGIHGTIASEISELFARVKQLCNFPSKTIQTKSGDMMYFTHISKDMYHLTIQTDNDYKVFQITSEELANISMNAAISLQEGANDSNL